MCLFSATYANNIFGRQNAFGWRGIRKQGKGTTENFMARLAKEKQSQSIPVRTTGDRLIVNRHGAGLARASADATVDRHLQEGRSLS